MPKETYCEKLNYITSSYLGLFRSSRPQLSILEISPDNTGGRVLLLVRLQTDCPEWRLYTKMTPPSSEAAVHSHSFSKISPGNTGGRVLLLDKLQIGCSE